MHIYSIIYELNSLSHNYTDLYQAIRNLGDCQHPIKSMWLLKCDFDSATLIANYLKPHILDRDRLFVVDVTNSQHQGNLPKRVWAWLKL